jgi:hypothetical protein
MYMGVVLGFRWRWNRKGPPIAAGLSLMIELLEPGHHRWHAAAGCESHHQVQACAVAAGEAAAKGAEKAGATVMRFNKSQIMPHEVKPNLAGMRSAAS